MSTKNAFFSGDTFLCEKCDYLCSRKCDYDRHIKTKKHLSTFVNKNASAYFECICGKKYKERSGIWRHHKNCESVTNSVHTSTETVSDNDVKGLVTFLLQENKEFKQMLLEQNKTIIEMASKQQSNLTQINNTQINNNKQKFNLNFFLNETCKDAMNITDFVNSLQIQFSDLEKVGELGYAEGISRIFMKGLKALDVCKRPIHCTDLKREIVHIKNNNKWEKEISLLQKAIKIITNNNINKITDWKNAHPGCTDGENKMNDTYCKILYESMGPIDEEQEQKDFSKIIRNIAKCTVIDKAIGENDE